MDIEDIVLQDIGMLDRFIQPAKEGTIFPYLVVGVDTFISETEASPKELLDKSRSYTSREGFEYFFSGRYLELIDLREPNNEDNYLPVSDVAEMREKLISLRAEGISVINQESIRSDSCDVVIFYTPLTDGEYDGIIDDSLTSREKEILNQHA